ncbi:interferon-inducible double-stranded RNA-dependent protein kinase activator A isoform X1 [Amblyraja radiata]|uniref:interferon-inducible double-stranded RNA-dependent protein kinase activator A isoform X1 n=1 Tax=Amblyraja radiata TaxID=386614 RepID=UPI001403E48F|nr:interferon-inducible double-stranded RNA-dependent protein kinase activator A isoform X1 [Amblyraja radiata]XP_055493871.1 interferon-inducible double-stranded RNA-dependent protein kinase activator A homolog isoform X1 [Leucoraja erinacea]
MSEERFTAASKRSSGCTGLEQVIVANPGKTPISLLQEYCTKNGKTPQYELVNSEGQAHLPSFTFRATVGEVSCKGQGQSKKAAKHKAAAAVLNILNGGSPQDTIYDGISYALQDPEPITSLKQAQNPPNPIGALQELVVQKGWRLPDYSIAEELGPPHKREFAIVCKVETFEETGFGTSKKLAKRAAATKMIAKLQNIPTGWNGGEEFKTEGVSLSNLKHDCAQKSGNEWNGSRGTWDLVRRSPGEKINQLKRSPLSIPNTDYTQMLGEVVEEQGFDVTYLDIDELTVNGQYQCLAELSTLPVTVCHGTGISRGNAHNEAAHNALQYVKIMAGRN